MTSGQGARMPFQHRVSPTCQSSRQCPWWWSQFLP
jgi:hypothetical protein